MLLRITLALALLRIPRLIFRLVRSLALMAWILITGSLAILVRIVTPSSDVRLRDLDRATPQGLFTEGTTCPRCHRLNDYEAHTCFWCGSHLDSSPERTRLPSGGAIVFGIVLAVALWLFLLLVG